MSTGSDGPAGPARRAELQAQLAQVRQRIADACVAAGRTASEVTLVAVTKTWPASDVAVLRDLGVTDVGENKDGEAVAKAAEVSGLRWHFVGRVQTNKARSVTSYVDVVHSLDRARLAHALSAGAVRAGREVAVLVQVALAADGADRGGAERTGADRGGAERGGALPREVLELADLAAGLPGLRLAGVMAVAPLGAAPEPAFAKLAELAQDLREHHPEARTISAGMSGDLEAAIAAGATHVRVGTALLGHRPAVLR